MRSAIAIVGMACELPDACTPAELWDNVLACRRAFRRIPAERLRLEDYLSPGESPGHELPDSIYSTRAAVLEGWEFDRVRFRVAGPSFRSADLAHWLALEVAARALADAGFPEGEGLPAAETGVVVGNTLTGEFSRSHQMRLRWPYVRRVLAAELLEQGWSPERCDAFLGRLEASYKRPWPEPTGETLAGGLSNTIAGRICNHFDLGGGGFTVDGACSSSLLAVIQACTALAAGDVDVALAGGVDLSLDPFELVGFARTGALAPGPMRVFDAHSQGFIPGEGCGFVVLMRRREAVEQGHRIHAVVRGWGVSSDGSGSITRPEAEGQRRALSRAYRRAGFGIGTVGYFEAHGTGTEVGDATELAALSAERREADPQAPPAVVGSVKANIGHTKAAAGVAALIKAVMAVRSQILPPNTGCEEPHPLLAGGDGGLRMLGRGEPWSRRQPLRAGVSAFGFGGINTHLVVESAGRKRRRSLTAGERVTLRSPQDCELLLLAGRNRAELERLLSRLAALAARISQAELADLGAELVPRLPGARWRAAMVVRDGEELAHKTALLQRWLDEAPEGVSHRLDPRSRTFLGRGPAARLCGFLFPGQGSPSHLGGGALVRRFEEAEEVYRAAVLPGEGDAVATEVAQPAIVAASLTALAVLGRLGVEAAVAVGHSLGELTALHWAGALEREAVQSIAAARGRAIAERTDGEGLMASVSAPAAVVEAMLGPGAAISGYNSPYQTVISGDAGAVREAVARARGRGLNATFLPVSHAFHSPLVAAAAPALAEHLGAVRVRRPRRPVASTVTGTLLPPEEDLRALLVRQVTSPVRFQEAVEAAGGGVAGGVGLWLEVGPGRVLSGLVRDLGGAPVVALDAGGPSLAGLLAAVGAAHALGQPVEAEKLFAGRLLRPFPLDRELRFLANPCEQAPLAGPVPGRAAERREATPSWPVTVGSAAAAEAPAPLALVRHLVAVRAELPPEAVGDDNRLLSDLHLNSIVVGQVVSEAARGLGLAPRAFPTDYADATVAEVARALAERAAAEPGGEDAEALPAGVAPWVRPFTVELVERPRPRAAELTGDGEWHLLGAEEHPLGLALAEELAAAGGGGLALCLPEDPRCAMDLFLEAARFALSRPDTERFLAVGPGGGGFARTFHLEFPRIDTCLVEAPLDHPEAAVWAVAEMRAARGYLEVHYDAAGTRREPELRRLRLPPAASRPVEALLGEEDVLLVTGGGRGIGAECALDLARETGTRLALLGRSRPEESPELTANLERMRAAGLRLAYYAADVTDPAAVVRAVRRAERELGPVTGVLHSAGHNRPRPMRDLDDEAVLATIAPKVNGLVHVLEAVAPERLRLLVTFGSIIARTGMVGEADYAVANEWLTRATEYFAREHPACRCLALEWSVWSGVGMGERLGRVEALAGQGITPIPPDRGVEMLRRLLAAPESPVAVVVAGRFGQPPTLSPERRELPLLRFLELPRVDVPGVELVVEAELSGDSDPYLSDHVFHGERLFPAVLGLEAMAQAAMAAAGENRLPVFEDVRLERPVVVPEGRASRVRIAALVGEDDRRVEVVLRSEETGFVADHFRAVCVFGEEAGHAERLVPGAPAWTPREALPPLPLVPEPDLYGGLLFQQGRFRRLAAYRELKATECLAEIAADGSLPWFARHLPPDLVLGDPAARDAVLHGIQPSVPHATLLPVAVERLWAGCLTASDPWWVAARERYRDGDLFVYDVEVLDAGGRVVERWEGLELQAVERVPPPAAWRPPLLGPYVERRLEELIPGTETHVLVERGDGATGAGRSAAGDRVLRRLVGAARVHRRSDGKPELEGGPEVSLAHAGDLVMAVSGRGPLGCDLEPVVERPERVWRDLLGTERLALAELIAAEHGGGRDAAATRVWAAAECLKKAGVLAGAPLVLSPLPAGEAPGEGWLLLRSGDLSVATLAAPVEGVPEPMVVAVLTGREA